jgi:hypothetical protein
VGCAADLGNDAEYVAFTHQLARESGGVSVSVSESFQRRRPLSPLVAGALAGGIVQMACRTPKVPVYPGQTAEANESQANPIEPRTGTVCTADRLIFVGAGSALGGEPSARRTGCGPSAVAGSLVRTVGVGAPAGEGFTGDGKRKAGQSVMEGADPPVAALGTATAALLERGLSVNVRALRRMEVRGMSCGLGVL